MKNIVLIVHNVRSSHNVGSILRTADGLGVNAVYLTGYTPHPIYIGDKRLPHEAKKVSKQINKTALGAENHVTWYREDSVETVIKRLKNLGFIIAALEQTQNSVELNTFKAEGDIALVVGREVEGIESEVLSQCNKVLEIPMYGSKESFNVAVAAALGIYQLKFAI